MWNHAQKFHMHISRVQRFGFTTCKPHRVAGLFAVWMLTAGAYLCTTLISPLRTALGKMNKYSCAKSAKRPPPPKKKPPTHYFARFNLSWLLPKCTCEHRAFIMSTAVIAWAYNTLYIQWTGNVSDCGGFGASCG